MAYEIKMKVQEKMAFYAGGLSMMVCDNADYELVLDLDAEWDPFETVTVLFTLPAYQGTIETLCTGRRCPVPLVQTPGVLRIGVTAGEVLHTTRWLEINVLPSIRTTAGREAAAVPPDLAQQIIERIDELEKGGGGSGGGTSFVAGNALELTDNVLGVKTADKAEAKNDLPITSGAVYDIAGTKLDKKQDAKNAGKLLYVGSDGVVAVLALGNGLEIKNGVLMLTNATVTEAICGRAVCGEIICGGI